MANKVGNNLGLGQMSYELTASDIERLAGEISQKLSGSRCERALGLRERTILLQFSRGGLLVCLRSPFLRIHLSRREKSGQSTPFTQLLDRELSGRTLLEVHRLGSDRILRLAFEGGTQLIAELIPKRPSLYLVSETGEILASLLQTDALHYQPPPAPTFTEGTSTLTSAKVEQLFALLEAQQELSRWLRAELKRCRKRHSRLKAELEDARAWEALHREGELLKAHFHLLRRGLQSVTVQDWYAGGERELALVPKLSPDENVARRFKLSRKRRLAIPHLERLLSAQEALVAARELQLVRCSSADSLEVLEEIKANCGFTPPRSSGTGLGKKVSPAPRLPYREYVSAAGLAIWVGRGARDNEQLTFSSARGNDLWLHVRDYAGSHVVVRLDGGVDPDEETLQDALQLALHYSKAREAGWADLCITRCKYVSKLKGSRQGQVSLSKHRVMTVRVDPARLNRLLQCSSSSGSTSRKR